ncbi:MAG: anthranilate phosphoribosyltransferase [Caulobacterales bacterium]|nr:anthranilate phosphoribosyltransferase [Caulobacterales bacterium]
MSDLKPVLAALAEGRPLTESEAESAFAIIMDGQAQEAQIGAFLMALRVRGETLDELVAGARAMRARAASIEAADDVIDTCGTGGDASGTYNISTAAAIVAAGAGAKVAKHGARAVSSRAGSSDVLAALGVDVEAGPEGASAALAHAGVGFLFAPSHHAAMRHVMGARAALGVRTIFNMMGPLTNPASARRQLVGVFARDRVVMVAEALARLGAVRAWVVHGSDGLDELTTTGLSYVASLEHGRIGEFVVDPGDVGLPRARPDDLKGGDAAENAAAIHALLDGEPGPFRDIVALNAGAALLIAGRASDLAAGVRQAQSAIDSGAARAALEGLVLHSQRVPK